MPSETPDEVRGVWRCSNCGNAVDPMDGRTRWNGKAFEHKCEAAHPQSGHSPCRYFGPPARPAETDAEALLARVAELEALLAADPEVKRFTYTPEDGVEVELEHWAVRHIAASLWKTFEDDGGPNYLVQTVHGTPKGPMEVTIRPVWGNRRTPTMDLADAKKRIAELEALVATLADRCEKQSTLLSRKAEGGPHG